MSKPGDSVNRQSPHDTPPRPNVASASKRRLLWKILSERYGLTRMPQFQRLASASPTSVRGKQITAAPLSRAKILTTAKPRFSVRILNHLTYGATEQSIQEFDALGRTDYVRLTTFVDQQLNWANIADGAVETRLNDAGYVTLRKTLPQLWEDHVKTDPEYTVRMLPAREVQRAALVRAVYSKRQLREVVVNFWHDHFNVFVHDYTGGPVYVHYTNEVIRKHALGNFRALLEAVATSTSMLYYLNNRTNTRAGPNENFARELLELHTLGAENYLGFVDPTQVPPCPEDPTYPIGYTDSDVYETAACFTGWTVKNGNWQYPNENDGTFVYRSNLHDVGPKYVLGQHYPPGQGDMQDGRDVLDRLASHPRVAKFICSKLIRRFVADDPPASLVNSAAAIFRDNWQHPDQIKLTLRHILTSDAMYNSWGQKMRRPFEAIVAAMRVLDSRWTPRPDDPRTDELTWRLAAAGHGVYEWPSPNGYPDTAAAWSGGNSLAMTWRMLNWLTERNDEAGEPLIPVVAYTRAGLPPAQWTATKLVDFWSLRILGYKPASARRDILRAFMAQNGNPDTDVISDNDDWSIRDLKRHYNHQRLRSMVSLLLLSPEFLAR